MADPTDLRIGALQARLAAVLAENELLTARAEDILLLGQIAESLVQHADEKTLLPALLERLAILKNLAYCALFTLGTPSVAPDVEYAVFCDDATGARLDARGIDADVAQRLDPQRLQLPTSAFEPAAALLVPFRTFPSGPQVLVVADDRSTSEHLIALSPVLQELGRMILSRLETLDLEVKLAAANAQLQRTIAERTHELEHTRTALETEVEERRRAQAILRQTAAAFEEAREGVVVTDAGERILSVNRAFTEVTGYTADEVLGKTPRILQSGMHDREFYARLWSELRDTGRWHGEIWNRRKDGRTYPELLTITAVKDDAGHTTNFVAVFTDLTAVKESEARLDYATRYDTLTGLPNRQYFAEQGEQVVSQARQNGESLAVMIVGIDGFKALNETLGPAAGDELLRRVASLLRDNASAEDLAGRFAGDEYILLVRNAADRGVAARFLSAVDGRFDLAGQEVFVSCSAGVSFFPDDGADLASLQRNAHVAFHKARESGRNSFQLCTPSLRTEAQERFAVETGLRPAIQRGEFVLHFQPQYSLANGMLVGLEALARWEHPTRGLLMPKSFIAVAEETGIIEELGRWALHAACARAMAWRKDGAAPCRVAVNLSPREIAGPALVASVSDALTASGLEPELLELEITETSIMREPEEAQQALRALKQLGVRLAIDDFGTGYSSLSYLGLLPVDELKIDRSFVRDLPSDGAAAAIARAVITLGHGLGLTVVAEGVETAEQEAFLREHGCDMVQGYYYARPLHAGAVAPLLMPAPNPESAS